MTIEPRHVRGEWYAKVISVWIFWAISTGCQVGQSLLPAVGFPPGLQSFSASPGLGGDLGGLLAGGLALGLADSPVIFMPGGFAAAGPAVTAEAGLVDIFEPGVTVKTGDVRPPFNWQSPVGPASEPGWSQ